jgi:pyridinium-3,5-bisthiocarboxylic acid mononucleotide nickel chelatase
VVKNSQSHSAGLKFEKDVVSIVETNVDDVTGEILARTIERLMKAGAYDATVSSFLGKKGRIGQTVRVVCERKSAEKFGEILVEETGTFGVKTTEWTRLIVPRKILSVSVKVGKHQNNLNVKIWKSAAGFRIKPELEEAKKISESEGIPLREVMETISAQARSQIKDL